MSQLSVIFDMSWRAWVGSESRKASAPDPVHVSDPLVSSVAAHTAGRIAPPWMSRVSQILCCTRNKPCTLSSVI